MIISIIFSIPLSVGFNELTKKVKSYDKDFKKCNENCNCSKEDGCIEESTGR